MLNKVLKKMREDEKKSGKTPTIPTTGTYPKSNSMNNQGFRAKQNSQEGAERQRSMGNRNNKTAR